MRNKDKHQFNFSWLRDQLSLFLTRKPRYYESWIQFEHFGPFPLNFIIKRFSDQILKSKQYVFNTSLSYIFICPIGSRRKEQETWLCIYKTVFWSNFGWQSSLLWKTNIQSNSPTLKVPFPGNEKVENIKVDHIKNALEQKPTKTTRLKLTGKGRRDHTEIVKEDH